MSLKKSAHLNTNVYIKDTRLFTKNRLDIAEGMIAALVIFGIAAIIVPSTHLVPHADMIFSAATFLFAVASGYYIANRHDRYTQLRNYMVQEAGYLICMYDFSRCLNDHFAAGVAESIEGYMSNTYHYDLENYIVGAQTSFNELVDHSLLIREEMAHQHVAADKFAEAIENLIIVRQEIYILGQDKMTWFDWTSLITLSGLIFLSLFSIGFESTTVRVIAVLLSATLVLILLLIRDLDGMYRNEKLLMYGTFDQVFDKIKKPRVYLQSDIKDGLIVPILSHPYRILPK